MENWIENHITEISPKQYIPSLLHIIWIGRSPQPESLAGYVSKWKELMPHWTVRLWTNADLTEYEIHPEVLSRINEAHQGTQKADILKYYVVDKYGGVYVDADVEPIKNLDPILYLSDLVICHDNYVEWQYVSVGLFAASPNHPVLSKAVELCMVASINIGAPHMNTGPHVMGIAVSVVPPIDKKYTLLPMGAFYAYRNPPDTYMRFGNHLYAQSWDT